MTGIDFLGLGELQVCSPSWSVDDCDETWTLTWNGVSFNICPQREATWGVAVDAACEFMDRYPDGKRTPEHLMALCLGNARNQR